MRGPLRVDFASLGSGAALAARGVLRLLDSAGALDVSLGWMAVALTAVVGVILVLTGLFGPAPSRHD